MITWKQPLKGYEWLIHQIWYLELEQDDIIEQLPQLIPNPRAHLLFTPEDQGYCYQKGDEQIAGHGSHLLAASEQLLTLVDNAPLKRIGITFRPEGLYLLNKATEGLINQCGWFDWLPPMFDSHFQNVLWQCNTKQNIIDCVNHQIETLSLTNNIDKPFTVTQKTIALLEQQQSGSDHSNAAQNQLTENNLDINHLAKQCACSRRTLERSFRQVTGLSIKKYQLMMKLEQMILALYNKQGDIDWTAFSQQFGFSDQSHLIRQLKQQLKRTPSHYLENRDLTIDIYGDFE
ncbi:helix-turn-helix domain-containing protein [Photobacterium sp. DNB23_23_1]|uniref:AraC family transcriptional regulator n=1 Tax=Photobacterium pectinilyticum TaxID=2906793 RepID=A0ABT1MXP7_9GAMM|nr:AraC family transcriptional regulator [Photobacterium sp. ZSDE20]MCQ1057263.1 AraC family transcriptional regulator [Photobacterium sp. ZSDE20]MDD1821721.1 AraC family transcriptional regulator [Photobacterium sp. ZSDE20]